MNKELHWWEEFDNSVAFMRCLNMLKLSIVLVLLMLIVSLFFDLFVFYKNLYGSRIDETIILEAYEYTKKVSYNIFTIIMFLLLQKIYFWLVYKISVPKKILLGWISDLNCKKTTLKCILHKIKYQNNVKLGDILEINRIGNVEYAADQRLKDNEIAQKIILKINE